MKSYRLRIYERDSASDSDILKDREVYKKKAGISIPRGLLMESDPGLGKSLLASILMEESERKPFVFRKTSQGKNSFLDELRTVFAMAKEETPSILLLEDFEPLCRIEFSLCAGMGFVASLY